MQTVWALLVLAVPAMGLWVVVRRAMGPERTHLALAAAAYATAFVYWAAWVLLVARTSGGIAQMAGWCGALAPVLAVVAVTASVCSLVARELGSRWALVPFGLSVAGIALWVAFMIAFAHAT